VTRTTWHGPWPVLTNNGVDSARTIRMTSSSHATDRRHRRVARERYNKVYSGDWAAFAAKVDAWHARKRRR